VYYTDAIEAAPVNQLESLRGLCDDMVAGKVDTLLIVGGNPVYDAPHDFDFATKLQKFVTGSISVLIWMKPLDIASGMCRNRIIWNTGEMCGRSTAR